MHNSNRVYLKRNNSTRLLLSFSAFEVPKARERSQDNYLKLTKGRGLADPTYERLPEPL
jgi:hypothetical protein